MYLYYTQRSRQVGRSVGTGMWHRWFTTLRPLWMHVWTSVYYKISTLGTLLSIPIYQHSTSTSCSRVQYAGPSLALDMLHLCIASSDIYMHACTCRVFSPRVQESLLDSGHLARLSRYIYIYSAYSDQQTVSLQTYIECIYNRLRSTPLCRFCLAAENVLHVPDADGG